MLFMRFRAWTKERYPAGLIRPVHGSITWLIDQEAAEKLGEIES